MKTALLHHHSIQQRKRKSRSGIALLLVIPAVALAAVLSYAVLANAGMQNQITANAQFLTQADCFAESGINYAMYELQQSVTSQNMPASIAFTSTPINVGNVQESFTVNSVSTGTNPVTYTITSIGSVTVGSTTNPISRKIVVSVQIPLTTSSQSSGSGSLHSNNGNHGGHASGSGSLSGGSSGSSTTLQVPQNVQAIRWSQ